MQPSSPFVSKLLSCATAIVLLTSPHCAVADNDPVKKTASYQTVTFYSEYHDHVVRWPDGKIRVYDKSGFKQWAAIFERLQPFMPRVILSEVSQENEADIIFEAVDTLPIPYEHTCGVTQNYIGADNSSIKKSRIKIRRIPNCIGDNKELGLYMHELGHGLGFARHTKDADVMGTYENHGKEIHIQTLSAFLTGLYRLPLGTPFVPEDRFELVDKPTDWDAVTGKQMDRSSMLAAQVSKESVYRPVQSTAITNVSQKTANIVTTQIPQAAPIKDSSPPATKQSSLAPLAASNASMGKPVVALAVETPQLKAGAQVIPVTSVTNENREITPIELSNPHPEFTPNTATPKVTKPIIVDTTLAQKARSVESAKVIPAKLPEEERSFMPLASPRSLKMRQITVIGPDGLQTQWVMSDTQDPGISPDSAVTAKAHRKKTKN